MPTVIAEIPGTVCTVVRYSTQIRNCRLRNFSRA